MKERNSGKNSLEGPKTPDRSSENAKRFLSTRAAGKDFQNSKWKFKKKKRERERLKTSAL